VPTDLTGRSVLFVGVGAMGRPMAARLASAGAALRVADADPDRARAVAEDLGVTAQEILEAIEIALPEAGIVAFQTGFDAWRSVVGAEGMEPSVSVHEGGAGSD
jgi:glutamyl-tRNA reductase